MNKPLIVISLPIEEVDKFDFSNKKFDLIEVRLDYKKNIDIQDLEKLLFLKEKLILTIRDINEGGIFPVKDEIKVKIYKKAFDYGIKYDIEERFLQKHSLPYENMIVSSHYPDSLPSVSELIEKFKKYNNLFSAKVAVKNLNGYKSTLAKFLELFKDATVIPLGAIWYERISFSLLGSKLLYVYDKVPTGNGQPNYDDAIRVLDSIFYKSQSI